MKKLTAMFLMQLLAAGAAHAAEMPLTGTVGAVLERNPAVAGARSGVRAAESALTNAWTLSLPRVSAKSSAMRGDNPLFGFGSLLDQRNATQADFVPMVLNQPGYRTSIKGSIEAGMPLFTGFKLYTNRRVSKLALRGARGRAEGAEQIMRFKAVDAHLRLLLEKARLESLEARVRSAEEMAADARRLKGKGLVLGSDYYAAEAILGKLKAQRTQARSRVAAAERELAVLTGTAPGELVPEGKLAGGAGYELPDEKSLLGRALEDRGDLRASRARSEMAEAGSRLESLSLLPTVEAFASVEAATRDFNRELGSRVWGVRAVLPFGDAGYFSRKARAASQAEASRSMTEDRADAVRIELSRAVQGYQGVKESLPTVKWTLDQAEESLKLFRPLYRKGRQSVMEVLRAEDSLAQAEDAYLTSLYHLHAGYAGVWLAAGGLGDGKVAEIEKNLEAAR